jgi:succinyl-CoA synthetase alpha subunit
LIVCVTERIPVLDMVEVKLALDKSDCLLIGPNCPGIITPGECCIGIMPQEIFRKGSIGIVSRTGTLTYEAVAQTTAYNLGQSTCIGIGADPVHGLSFTDSIELFMQDPETKGIVLVGEIGGSEEEDAADYVRANKPAKPLVAYVAGRFAPAGRRMGHAGAIIQHGSGGADEKLEAMAGAGIHIADSPVTIGATMARVLGSR